MSSTSRTRSPGSIRKPRRNSRRVVPSSSRTSSAKMLRTPSWRAGLEGEDDPAGRRTGDEVDERRSPSRPRPCCREEAAQLARRGRILEDLELLDVGVAVAPALEQEVALAEGARLAEQRLGPAARSRAAALASSAGRTVVIAAKSTRQVARRHGPVLDALRRRRRRPSSGAPSRSGRGTIVSPRRPALRGELVDEPDRAASGRRRSPCRPGPRPRRRRGSRARRRARSRRRSRRPGSSTAWADLVDDPQRDRLDRRPATARRRCCRAAAAPRLGATAIPDSVLIAVSASAPASAMARAIGRMSATFGDSLTSSGRSVARRTAAVTSPAAPASIANWSPPAPTFGQRDVELDAGDARHAVEPPRDLDVVVRPTRPATLTMTGVCQRGPRLGVLLDDRVDARVLEPDRVEHPAGRLGHARRRVADPRP